jgi:hypothetical protein
MLRVSVMMNGEILMRWDEMKLMRDVTGYLMRMMMMSYEGI